MKKNTKTQAIIATTLLGTIPILNAQTHLSKFVVQKVVNGSIQDAIPTTPGVNPYYESPTKSLNATFNDTTQKFEVDHTFSASAEDIFGREGFPSIDVEGGEKVRIAHFIQHQHRPNNWQLINFRDIPEDIDSFSNRIESTLEVANDNNSLILNTVSLDQEATQEIPFFPTWNPSYALRHQGYASNINFVVTSQERNTNTNALISNTGTTIQNRTIPVRDRSGSTYNFWVKDSNSVRVGNENSISLTSILDFIPSNTYNTVSIKAIQSNQVSATLQNEVKLRVYPLDTFIMTPSEARDEPDLANNYYGKFPVEDSPEFTVNLQDIMPNTHVFTEVSLKSGVDELTSVIPVGTKSGLDQGKLTIRGSILDTPSDDKFTYDEGIINEFITDNNLNQNDIANLKDAVLEINLFRVHLDTSGNPIDSIQLVDSFTIGVKSEIQVNTDINQN